MKITSWNTTNACNLACAHCYRDSGEAAERELSTEEGLRLIDEIARAGFQIMIFSGGEPLLRPDILELIRHARDCGLRPVLGSNGTLLSLEMARALKDAGLMAAGISLDSLDAVKHDRLRGQKGAWQAAVMDWNADEICAITDFAVESGARGHHIFFLVPTGRGEKIEGSALPRRDYENTLRRIMEKARTVPIEIKPTCAPQFIRVADTVGHSQRFRQGCLAGTSYCIISPRGDVQPCAYLDLPLGNVRDLPFDRIWAENETLARLRTRDYSGSCGDCHYSDRCGGCRARAAYYHEGDIMSADPLCILNREGDADV